MHEIVVNLHMHTRYSDGSGTHKDIAQAAIKTGLDAVIVTDHNVLVQGVQRDVNALGYFGYAYYIENRDKLKAVPIVEKEGKPAVAPSQESVVNGTYQPLARPIFIYVSTKSAQRPEVKEFVEFFIRNGEKLAKEVKYVPLPAKAYTHNLETLAKMQAGTKFGGENKVGLTIEELMKLEAK